MSLLAHFGIRPESAGIQPESPGIQPPQPKPQPKPSGDLLAHFGIRPESARFQQPTSTSTPPLGSDGSNAIRRLFPGGIPDMSSYSGSEPASATRREMILGKAPQPTPILVTTEDFQFVKKLGEGTFGEVFKAKYIPQGGRHLEGMRTDEFYAVKKIKRGATPQALEELDREKELLEYITNSECNEYCAKFYGSFEDRGELYLIQEYLEGFDLFRFVMNIYNLNRQEKAQKIKISRGILCALLMLSKGLNCLHQVGVIHNDIKPGNAYITGVKNNVLCETKECGMGDRNDICSVKILDLGMGCFSMQSFHNIAENARQYGCQPYYVAPGTLIYSPFDIISARTREQPIPFEQRKAADVWALGATFFLLITGRMWVGQGYIASPNSVLASVAQDARTARVKYIYRDQLLPFIVPIGSKVIVTFFEDEPEEATIVDYSDDSFTVDVKHELISMPMSKINFGHPSYTPLHILVNSMLNPDWRDRPTMQEVVNELEAYMYAKDDKGYLINAHNILQIVNK